MLKAVSIRSAVANDEPFVLGLEEQCLRKLAESERGRFVPRPGMGDEFPTNCRIIECDDIRIGCLMTSIDEHSIHIEQLYLIPKFQRRGIGSWVVSDLMTKATKHRLRLHAMLSAQSEALKFFLALGFSQLPDTSMATCVEWAASFQLGITRGKTDV